MQTEGAIDLKGNETKGLNSFQENKRRARDKVKRERIEGGEGADSTLYECVSLKNGAIFKGVSDQGRCV